MPVEYDPYTCMCVHLTTTSCKVFSYLFLIAVITIRMEIHGNTWKCNTSWTMLKQVLLSQSFTYCHYLPLLPLRSVTWGRCIRLKVCHLAPATCTDGEPHLGRGPCEAGCTTKTRGSVGRNSPWAGSLGRRGWRRGWRRWRGCIQLLLGFLWFGLPGDGLDSLHNQSRQSQVSDQRKDQALSETEQSEGDGGGIPEKAWFL